MMHQPAPPTDLWQQLPPLRHQEVLQTLVPLLLAHLEKEIPPSETAPPEPQDKEKNL